MTTTMPRLPDSATRHPDVPLVYVIRTWVTPIDGYGTNELELGWKIGRTTNLPLRIGTHVSTRGHAELVALGHGDYSEETAIHRELADFRHGSSYGVEWYLDCQGFRMWLPTFAAVWRGSIVCNGSGKYPGIGRRGPWRGRVERLTASLVNAERVRGALPLMTSARRYWSASGDQMPLFVPERKDA